MERGEVLLERVSDLLLIFIDSIEFGLANQLQQVSILFAAYCALSFIKEVGQVAFTMLVYFLEVV